MVRCGLRHWVGQECDFRVGLLLANAGLLKKEITFPSLPREVVEAIGDSDHDARIPGPPGPVVFLKEAAGAKTKVAHSVLEMVCAPDRAVREAALTHFESATGEADSFLSPFSQNLLREYGDDLRSEDTDRWLAAAMRLEQELDTDFTFSLAAFRQGVLIGLREIQDAHWAHVLRPSVASLLSVHDDGYGLIKSRDGFLSTVRRMVEESATLDELLTRYEGQLGHLPLCPDLSIGAAAHLWLKDQPCDVRWETLREWEQQAPLSLRRLLICQIALLNPSVVAEDERDQFWDDFTALVNAQREDDASSQFGPVLALEADLARHYFQYLESRTVGMDVELLATVAWWAANAVSIVLVEYASHAKDPLATIRRIRDDALQRALDVSSAAWQMSHPYSGRASIRYATLFDKQPRILGLLLAMEGRLGQLPIEALRPEQRETITEGLVTRQIMCFPVRAETSEKAVWAFDRPFAPVFTEWTTVVLDEAAAAKHEGLLALSDTLTDFDALRQSLTDLSHADANAQAFIAHLFCVLANGPDCDAEQLWEFAVNAAWPRDCLCRLDEGALPALFTGIMDLQQRVGGGKDVEVSHWFADAAEAPGLGAERQSVLFGMTVVASAITGTVSAIRRLVQKPVGGDLADNISHWQSQVEAMLPIVPPELAARLRDILSSLRST